MQSAEDALADAFAAALSQWPAAGVPDRPEAWLLTAAKRRLIDAERRRSVRDAALPKLAAATDEAAERAWRDDVFPDERMEMLFACAHPAIDRALHAPLMLRAVLNIDAGRIASAFLVSPDAMRQRLVRVKSKMRTTGVHLAGVEPHEIAARLPAVLDAVYAAFGIAWDDCQSDGQTSDLRYESIFLARLLVEKLSDQPEAYGLLSLFLFIESRRNARRNKAGEYVPLDRQDIALWSRPMMFEADAMLRRAGTAQLGRFQLEAGIQSMHAARAFGRDIDWAEIAFLYDLLVQHTDSLGAAIGRAAAHAKAFGASAGLALLDGLPQEALQDYQPYWALRAELRADEDDYARAIGLTEDRAVRAYLVERRSMIVQPLSSNEHC